MSTIEHSVDVRVPVRVAYDQWTQFESFPQFMEGVESVKQLTDTRTQWLVDIAGVTREFEAEITEQHPDERIAWRSVDSPHQGRSGDLPPARRRHDQGHAADGL
ncbi:SRPBCC family protein [Nonomuraea dietziae]|uniref:SRPBCC family protein n=1 Tax=Nonomuraea dietziae TaxID=65515 RepID=UPI0031D5F040